MSTRDCGSCRSSRSTTPTWSTRSTSNGIQVGGRWTPAANRPCARSATALGVPRHPIDVFYNVSHQGRRGVRVQLDLRLRRPTAAAGVCTDQHGPDLPGAAEPEDRLGLRSSCQRQITDHARPRRCWRTTRGRSTCHQSNLTRDRLLLPGGERGAVGATASVFAGNAPIVNQRLSADGRGAATAQDQLGADAERGHGQRLRAGQHGHHHRAVRHLGAGDGAERDQGRHGQGRGVRDSAYGGRAARPTRRSGSGALTLVLKAAPYPGSSASAPQRRRPTSPETQFHTVPSTTCREPGLALPKGKLGSAILNATSGPATAVSP